MSILFGSDVDIQLANTSFNCNTTSSMSVALFTATDKGTYHFTGTLTATTQNSSFGFGFLINGTYKDLRTTDYTTGPLDVNLDFTADVGDVITLSASGIGTGSNLAVTEDVKKPREIYVGEGTLVNDYSAMQGPAPTGYHVPLSTERQAVHNIWTALGGGSSDGTNFGIALKLPFAGGRDRSNSNVYSQGVYGNYWSPTRYNERNAYNLYFHSSGVYFQSNFNRAYGFSVRCFKDTPTIPTSSWAKLYGTSIEAGGIFWSSADGLISLSSDGQTWVTIADKNLGATTVWNSGDTLSEANCGKYYQWGNNYGFPRTGTIANQSTMQVDASNYGPGNYYSSDTFIKYSGRWDSTDNGNLRGGETGVQQKYIGNVKEVYVGTTKVRPNEIYVIDLSQSYNGYIPQGDPITKIQLIFSNVTSTVWAQIFIGSGNNNFITPNQYSLYLPGQNVIYIAAIGLEGTAAYDFSQTTCSWDFTNSDSQSASGSGGISDWILDTTSNIPITWTPPTGGDALTGTVTIKVERDTSNTSTNQGQQSGGSGQGENNGGNR